MYRQKQFTAINIQGEAEKSPQNFTNFSKSRVVKKSLVEMEYKILRVAAAAAAFENSQWLDNASVTCFRFYRLITICMLAFCFSSFVRSCFFNTVRITWITSPCRQKCFTKCVYFIISRLSSCDLPEAFVLFLFLLPCQWTEAKNQLMFSRCCQALYAIMLYPVFTTQISKKRDLEKFVKIWGHFSASPCIH